MTKRLTALAFGVTVLVATNVSAQSNWPQFRGAAAGVALPTTQRFPRQLGTGREHRLVDRRAGARLELPHRVGRARVRPDLDRRQWAGSPDSAGRELPGPFARRHHDPRRHHGGVRTPAVGTLRRRIRERRHPVGAHAPHGGAVRADAPEEHICRRRHRSPTGSAYLRLSGRTSGCSRSTLPGSRSGRCRWTGCLDATGAPPRRPCSTDERLYVVNDNDEQSFIAAHDAATGDGAVADKPGRGGRTGRHRSSGRTTCGPRSSPRASGGVRSYGVRRRAALAPHRHVDTCHPDPILRAWVAVHQLGGMSPTRTVRSTPSGLAPAATSRWGRAQPATTTSSGRIHAARLLQPVVAGLRRLPLHVARPGHSSCATTRAPGRRCTHGSGSRRVRCSPHRRGRTTARSSP